MEYKGNIKLKIASLLNKFIRLSKKNSYSKTILIILIFIFISDMHTFSQGQCLPNFPWICSEQRINPIDTSLVPQPPRPKWLFEHYCYEVGTYIQVPCRFVDKIEIKDNGCDLTRSHYCGHIYSLHTPNYPTSFEVKGGLLEGWNCGNLSNELAYDDPPHPNSKWKYSYCAGRIMLNMQITSTAYPSPYYWVSFLSPPCQSRDYCQHEAIISVGYKDLEELPASAIIWNGKPIVWVRCGNIACNTDVDSAYSWADHPTVHWGNNELLAKLKCLAKKWFIKCSVWKQHNPPEPECKGYDCLEDAQNLGITDMSLPGGGLLDIGSNWASPHSRHQHGTDADLCNNSVPSNNPNRCGPVPSGTTDNAWLDPRNPLWSDPDDLGGSCGLRYPRYSPTKSDPGHVCVRRNANSCL